MPYLLLLSLIFLNRHPIDTELPSIGKFPQESWDYGNHVGDAASLITRAIILDYDFAMGVNWNTMTMCTSKYQQLRKRHAAARKAKG